MTGKGKNGFVGGNSETEILAKKLATKLRNIPLRAEEPKKIRMEALDKLKQENFLFGPHIVASSHPRTTGNYIASYQSI